MQLPSHHNHCDIAHLEMIIGVYTKFDDIHHSDLYPVFVRVECETQTSELTEHKLLVRKIEMVVSIITSSFLVYIFDDFPEAVSC